LLTLKMRKASLEDKMLRLERSICGIWEEKDFEEQEDRFVLLDYDVKKNDWMTAKMLTGLYVSCEQFTHIITTSRVLLVDKPLFVFSPKENWTCGYIRKEHVLRNITIDPSNDATTCGLCVIKIELNDRPKSLIPWPWNPDTIEELEPGDNMIIMSSKGSATWVTAFTEPVVEYRSKQLGSLNKVETRVIPISTENLSVGSPIFRSQPNTKMAFRNIVRDENLSTSNNTNNVDYIQASNVSNIVTQKLAIQREQFKQKPRLKLVSLSGSGFSLYSSSGDSVEG